MNIYAFGSILVLCVLYQGADARRPRGPKPDCDGITCTDLGCAAGQREAKIFGECCPSVCVLEACPDKLPSADKCRTACVAGACTGADDTCCNDCCISAGAGKPTKPDCTDIVCTDLGCAAGQREAKIFGECCPSVCVLEACPSKLPSADKCRTACVDGACTGADENCCNDCCIRAKPSKPDCDGITCTDLGCAAGQREAKIFGECCPSVCVLEACPAKLPSADKCRTACVNGACTGTDENCCNDCCISANGRRPGRRNGGGNGRGRGGRRG